MKNEKEVNTMNNDYGRHNIDITCNDVFEHEKLFISFPASGSRSLEIIHEEDKYRINFGGSSVEFYKGVNNYLIRFYGTAIESKGKEGYRFLSTRPSIKVKFNHDGDGGIRVENDIEVLSIDHIVYGQDVYYRVALYNKKFEDQMKQLEKSGCYAC